MAKKPLKHINKIRIYSSYFRETPNIDLLIVSQDPLEKSVLHHCIRDVLIIKAKAKICLNLLITYTTTKK